jgi:proteasome alpha subunit
MQPIQHQMMGYDRAITMFSPDGRLLQVEYAKKTVKLGNTAIGIVCNDGVLLVTDKRIVDKLVVTSSVEKIFKIDDHIIATASGIMSDARILIERAQVKAQQNQITYDSPIDVLSIVKEIANLKQMTTQIGGYRPFGVSVLFAGRDETGIKLFETDPAGLYNQFNARVIGESQAEIEEKLHKEYDKAWTLEDGLKFAVKSLKETLDNDFASERIDAAFIRNDGNMEKVSKDKIKKMIKK